jgi:hypothetical protein
MSKIIQLEGYEDEFETLMAVQSQLKVLKAQESEMRKDLALKILENQGIGTHSFASGHFMCKATKKVSYTIDRATLEEFWDDMTDAEQDAIDLKPTLKLKNYKALTDSDMIDESLIVKPSMPSLVISMIGEEM